MKFLELNKKRHAVKHFNDKPVDFKDVRTAIEIATLAPSANNIQPWKFVVVQEKKSALAEGLPESNCNQINQAQYVIALFTDWRVSLFKCRYRCYEFSTCLDRSRY